MTAELHLTWPPIGDDQATDILIEWWPVNWKHARRRMMVPVDETECLIPIELGQAYAFNAWIIRRGHPTPRLPLGATLDRETS